MTTSLMTLLIKKAHLLSSSNPSCVHRLVGKAGRQLLDPPDTLRARVEADHLPTCAPQRLCISLRLRRLQHAKSDR